MKTPVTTSLLIVLFFSCGNMKRSGDNARSESALNTEREKTQKTDIAKTEFNKTENEFYIIRIADTADIQMATERVRELRGQGFSAGYLWIPDFPSLDKKERFMVYLGTFPTMISTIKYLENYRRTDPNAYAIKVSAATDRLVIFGKYDIRKNNVRQFLIFIFARPAEVEEYLKRGGEDWCWFVDDVGNYFRKHYPDRVLMEDAFNSWLSPADVKELEKELPPTGFGYILIDGEKKSFTPHNMPEEVIKSVCQFFGLEEK